MRNPLGRKIEKTKVETPEEKMPDKTGEKVVFVTEQQAILQNQAIIIDSIQKLIGTVESLKKYIETVTQETADSKTD